MLPFRQLPEVAEAAHPRVGLNVIGSNDETTNPGELLHEAS